MEGTLRHIANPHSERRMQLILDLLMEWENGTKSEDVGESDENDEVSFIYYGENCSCSKTAQCKSSKCLCFLRREKCSSKCHSEMKNKCTNK